MAAASYPSYAYPISFQDPSGAVHTHYTTPVRLPSLASSPYMSSGAVSIDTPASSSLSAYETPSAAHSRHPSLGHLIQTLPHDGQAAAPSSRASRRLISDPYPRSSPGTQQQQLLLPHGSRSTSSSDSLHGGGIDEDAPLDPSSGSIKPMRAARGRQTPQTESENRSRRQASERRRRDTVRDHLADLQQLLPHLPDEKAAGATKMTKGKILERSVQLVVQLQSEIEDYARRLAATEARNHLLSSMLARSQAQGLMSSANDDEAAALHALAMQQPTMPCAATMRGLVGGPQPMERTTSLQHPRPLRTQYFSGEDIAEEAASRHPTNEL